MKKMKITLLVFALIFKAIKVHKAVFTCCILELALLPVLPLHFIRSSSIIAFICLFKSTSNAGRNLTKAVFPDNIK